MGSKGGKGSHDVGGNQSLFQSSSRLWCCFGAGTGTGTAFWESDEGVGGISVGIRDG